MSRTIAGHVCAYCRAPVSFLKSKLGSLGLKYWSTLKVHVPDQKVVEHYELGKGAPVLVTGGQHVGQIAHVLEIQRTRNPRANIVTFTEGFSTDAGKVFVVGKEAPSIKTPEASAL